MGIYLNPGNTMFQRSLDSRIYVDKSGLIARLNDEVLTRDCYVCVSRPRRFGKSTTLDMLAAYYDRTCDSRSQFENLAVAGDSSYEKHLNKYDVIRIVMQDFMADNADELIERLEERVAREVAQAYPDVASPDDEKLSNLLARVFQKSGVPFVILIDEWDCVMRDFQDDEAAQKKYLDWLRGLLKDKPYVGLAYATGILPIKKYGQHSALNMFNEVSVLNAVPFSEFTGFTESEVAQLCEQYNTDASEIARWYDGYNIDGVMSYNPRSVVMALNKGVFDSYWTRTETFEALRRYIVLNFDHLREKIVELIGGGLVSVNTAKFQNDMTSLASSDDVLTLLTHLGYLTYDRSREAVRIPNTEVMLEFVNCIEDGGWEAVADAIAESKALVDATISRDSEQVAGLIERAHRDNASVLRYNDENSLACVLSIAYYAARRDYRIEREAPAGKGYADLVFWPRPGRDVPAFVVELKAGGSAADAVAQIRSRGYADALRDHPDALLVGVSYDPSPKSDAYKTHECVIEPI